MVLRSIYEKSFKLQIITKSIHFLLVYLIFINSVFSLTNTMAVSNTKAEYYDFLLNSSTTELLTEGSENVVIVITVVNTGNQKDTYTFISELIGVYDCAKPDPKEWKYELDRTITTLDPAYSDVLELTVESACTCQEGCRAAILVTGSSETDPNLKKTIIFNITRGPGKPPDGDSGLIIDIDYKVERDKFQLNTDNIITVYITNTQNNEDQVYTRIIDYPESWTVSVTPDEFVIFARSKATLILKVFVPPNIPAGYYRITLSAQSMKSPNINDQKYINIPIMPDIIIKNIEFSSSTIHAKESTKLIISVQNIGLATCRDISLAVFDRLVYTKENEINRFMIDELLPNKILNISYTWKPQTSGDILLAFLLDPDSKLNESRNDNNLRIEPVTIEKELVKNSEESDFLYAYILILIIIIVWLIIYFRYSKRKKDLESSKPLKEKMSNIKDRQTSKSKSGRNKPGNLK